MAIIVLISQNRAAKIDDLREEIDLHINTIAEKQITKKIELLVHLLKKNGTDVSKDLELQQMLEPTDKEKIERSLKNQIGWPKAVDAILNQLPEFILIYGLVY